MITAIHGYGTSKYKVLGKHYPTYLMVITSVPLAITAIHITCVMTRLGLIAFMNYYTRKSVFYLDEMYTIIVACLTLIVW